MKDAQEVSHGIVYIGLGYVGLTGAIHFAKAGIPVLGYDTDQAVVSSINAGNPRGKEFLSYLHQDLPSLLQQGLLRATSTLTDLVGSSTFILAVPSEKDGAPWMQPVIDTVLKILRLSEKPPLILIESTLTPGTAENIVTLAEQQLQATVGKDYWLSVCPRKDWFGDKARNLTNLPRVVGGMTKSCTERAVEVLCQVSDDIHRADAVTAELTKVVENGIFHENIMYVHQLALDMPHRNIAEAVRLACLHWRLPKLYLGFGSAGRCIPLGNRYLLEAISQNKDLLSGETRFSLGRIAIETDNALRKRIVEYAVQCCTNNAQKIAVLGLGYRPDFADVGLSPGLFIAQHLHQLQKLTVTVHDTVWSPEEIKKRWHLPFLPLSELSSCDLILLSTPHTEYHTLPQSRTYWRAGQIILDAQGTWQEERALFAQLGVHYKRVGDPGWLDVPQRSIPTSRA